MKVARVRLKKIKKITYVLLRLSKNLIFVF